MQNPIAGSSPLDLVELHYPKRFKQDDGSSTPLFPLTKVKPLARVLDPSSDIENVKLPPEVLNFHIDKTFDLPNDTVSMMAATISSTVETLFTNPTNHVYNVVDYRTFLPQQSTSNLLPPTWVKVDRVTKNLEILLSEAVIYTSGCYKDVCKGLEYNIPLSQRITDITQHDIKVSKIALHLLGNKKIHDPSRQHEMIKTTHQGLAIQQEMIANEIPGLSSLPICLNGQINVDDNLATVFKQPWYPSDLEKACIKQKVVCAAKPINPKASDNDEVALKFDRIKDSAVVLLDVCRTLQEMHKKGFGHGDIKASNILIDYVNGRFKGYLSDFDFAFKNGGAVRAGPDSFYAPFDTAAHLGYFTKLTDAYSIAILFSVLFLPVFYLDTPKPLLEGIFIDKAKESSKFYLEKLKKTTTLPLHTQLVQYTCELMDSILKIDREVGQLATLLTLSDEELTDNRKIEILNAKIDHLAPNLMTDIIASLEKMTIQKTTETTP